MTESSAATTRQARSMPVAPASMFLTKRSWPGTSTMPRRKSPRSRMAKPISMVMPRAFSSGRRSQSMPVRALTSEVLPWSMWPAVPRIRSRGMGDRSGVKESLGLCIVSGIARANKGVRVTGREGERGPALTPCDLQRGMAEFRLSRGPGCAGSDPDEDGMSNKELREWLGLTLADGLLYLAAGALVVMFFLKNSAADIPLAVLGIALSVVACPIGMKRD